MQHETTAKGSPHTQCGEHTYTHTRSSAACVRTTQRTLSLEMQSFETGVAISLQGAQMEPDPMLLPNQTPSSEQPIERLQAPTILAAVPQHKTPCHTFANMPIPMLNVTDNSAPGETEAGSPTRTLPCRTVERYPEPPQPCHHTPSAEIPPCRPLREQTGLKTHGS